MRFDILSLMENSNIQSFIFIKVLDICIYRVILFLKIQSDSLFFSNKREIKKSVYFTQLNLNLTKLDLRFAISSLLPHMLTNDRR